MSLAPQSMAGCSVGPSPSVLLPWLLVSLRPPLQGLSPSLLPADPGSEPPPPPPPSSEQPPSESVSPEGGSAAPSAWLPPLLLLLLLQMLLPTLTLEPLRLRMSVRYAGEPLLSLSVLLLLLLPCSRRPRLFLSCDAGDSCFTQA